MRHAISSLLFVGVIVSCGRAAVEEVNHNSGLKGFGIKDFTFTTTNIPVCFESHGEYDERMKPARTAIRDYINSEFSKTILTFSGWADCRSFRSLNDGIRISFLGGAKFSGRTYAQSNLGTGDGHSYMRTEMEGFVYAPTLTVNMSMWSKHDTVGSPSLSSQNANTLLHEMGHAVGMMHEHLRNPGCSNHGEESYDELKARVGASEFEAGVVQTAKHDPDSVMDYCNVYDHFERNTFAGLSAGDVQVINGLYRGKPRGMSGSSSTAVASKEEASGAPTAPSTPSSSRAPTTAGVPPSISPSTSPSSSGTTTTTPSSSGSTEADIIGGILIAIGNALGAK